MFFEYLSAGRCDALEDTYGAYNLYESECRANLIISQLNQIFESLEQIKKNQFTVYNELQAIKVAINDLAYSMDRLGDSLKYIKCDTTDMKDYLNTVSQNSSGCPLLKNLCRVNEFPWLFDCIELKTAKSHADWGMRFCYAAGTTVFQYYSDAQQIHAALKKQNRRRKQPELLLPPHFLVL